MTHTLARPSVRVQRRRGLTFRRVASGADDHRGDRRGDRSDVLRRRVRYGSGQKRPQPGDPQQGGWRAAERGRPRVVHDPRRGRRLYRVVAA